MFEKVRLTAQVQDHRNSHCVCDWLPTPHLMSVSVCVHARGGQRTTCGTQHSPSTMRVLNANLRPGSKCLYHWAILQCPPCPLPFSFILFLTDVPGCLTWVSEKRVLAPLELEIQCELHVDAGSSPGPQEEQLSTLNHWVNPAAHQLLSETKNLSSLHIDWDVSLHPSHIHTQAQTMFPSKLA